MKFRITAYLISEREIFEPGFRGFKLTGLKIFLYQKKEENLLFSTLESDSSYNKIYYLKKIREKKNFEKISKYPGFTRFRWF